MPFLPDYYKISNRTKILRKILTNSNLCHLPPLTDVTVTFPLCPVVGAQLMNQVDSLSLLDKLTCVINTCGFDLVTIAPLERDAEK